MSTEKNTQPAGKGGKKQGIDPGLLRFAGIFAVVKISLIVIAVVIVLAYL